MQFLGHRKARLNDRFARQAPINLDHKIGVLVNSIFEKQPIDRGYVQFNYNIDK